MPVKPPPMPPRNAAEIRALVDRLSRERKTLDQIHEAVTPLWPGCIRVQVAHMLGLVDSYKNIVVQKREPYDPNKHERPRRAEHPR